MPNPHAPPSEPPHDGDVAGANPRAEAACARACRAHDRVTDIVHRIHEDLDQITMPGVPIVIDEEDSLVTTIEGLLDRHKAVGT